jgi:hypothetical protein
MGLVDLGAPTQDYIVLGGFPSPGKAVIRGAGSPRKWDVRDGYGLTGAVTVFMGEGLATFEVDIYCWEDHHFLAWPIWAKLTLANPPIGARPTSQSIKHPQLNDPPLTIDQVVVTDVSQWEDIDETGYWMRTIKFLQYRKPRPALVKPFEGPPGSPINVKPPVDPEVLIIQQNAAQIAALAG